MAGAPINLDNVVIALAAFQRTIEPGEAPFDAILVAAAPDHVPATLVDQLAIGGRLIVPVGKYTQTLMLIERPEDRSITRRAVAPVAFVPMTGLADQH